MNIAWDPRKATENLLRHGVALVDTEAVFYDPRAITVEDHSATGERRFVTLGADNLGRRLVVVWTSRDDDVRVISARKASAVEREEYERQL